LGQVEVVVELRNAEVAGVVVGDVGSEPPVVELQDSLAGGVEVSRPGPQNLCEPLREGERVVSGAEAGSGEELHEVDGVACPSSGPLSHGVLGGA